MMRSGGNIAFIVALVLGLLLYACERIEPDGNDGAGEPFETVMNPDYFRLDSTVFSYVGLLDQKYVFEFHGEADLPIVGGLIYFYDSAFQIFGRVETIVINGGVLSLEISETPLNSLFDFMAMKNDLGDNENILLQYLNPQANLNSDTVKLEPIELLWDTGEGEWGLLNLDSVLVFNEIQGMHECYLGPWWSDSVGTHRINLNLNQKQRFSASINLIVQGNLVVHDSLKIRERRLGPYYADYIPVYYLVEEWLKIDINTTGNSVSKTRFTLDGTFKVRAKYLSDKAWDISSEHSLGDESFEVLNWAKLISTTASVSLNTTITPVFCGLQGMGLNLENKLEMSTSVEWPDWEYLLSNDIDLMLHSEITLFSDIPEIDIYDNIISRQLLTESGQLENSAPVPEFSINPGSGFTDTNFSFDAGNSHDAEGETSQLEGRWDFNGDEVWDTNYSYFKETSRYFLIPGNYFVVLEVRDLQGSKSQLGKWVNVEETSSAPKASFTVTPESGRTSDVFTFDASGSSDREDDVSLLKVRWDYEGDGEWDTEFSTVKAGYSPFPEAGTYFPKLQVKDTQGLTASTSREVRVEAANIKPTAFFTVSPEEGTINATFHFDASGSSDPEDDVSMLLVQWDFENDGVWDTEYRVIKTINHVFEVADSYTVVLRVLDTDDFSNTFSHEILVSNPNTKPKADFTINPTEGDTTTVFTFDARISEDLEDTIEQLQFRWDWENDNVYDTEYSSSPINQRTFSTSGPKLIKMQVKDSGGLTHTKTRMVIVE